MNLYLSKDLSSADVDKVSSAFMSTFRHYELVSSFVRLLNRTADLRGDIVEQT